MFGEEDAVTGDGREENETKSRAMESATRLKESDSKACSCSDSFTAFNWICDCSSFVIYIVLAA